MHFLHLIKKLLHKFWPGLGGVLSFALVFLGFVLYVAVPIVLAGWVYPCLMVRFFPAWQSDLGFLLGLLLAPPTYAAMIKVLEWVTDRSPSFYEPKNSVVPVSAPPIAPPVAIVPPSQTPHIHPPPPKILSQAQLFFMQKFDKLEAKSHLDFLYYWTETEFPPSFEQEEVETKFEGWVQSVLEVENYEAWVKSASFSIPWLDHETFKEMQTAFARCFSQGRAIQQPIQDEPEIQDGRREHERITQEFLTRIKWLGLSTRAENALVRWVKHLPSTEKGSIAFDAWKQSILDAESFDAWQEATGFYIRNFGSGMFSELKTALAAQAGMDEKDIERRFVWNEALFAAQRMHSKLVVSDDLSRQQEEFISGFAQLNLHGRAKTSLMKWVMEGFPDTDTPISPDLSFGAWSQEVLKASSPDEWPYAFRDFKYWYSFTRLQNAIAEHGVGISDKVTKSYRR